MSAPTKYDLIKIENQVCFPLYACAREVIKKYTPYLDELGITYTQYITLMVLWENNGIHIGELGKRLYLDSGTLTPLLKKMEQRGWVERKRSEQDERVVAVILTDKGWELREKAVDVPLKVSNCINLSQADINTLYNLLYRLLGQH